jgi:protein-disulfide isomerase
MKTAKTSEPAVRPLAPILLLSLAAAESLLSLFQWMELLVVRAGGHTVCGINDVINCEAVWSSAFAARIHGLTALPVAGLGLLWGLAAFGLSALLVLRLLAQTEPRVAVVALRWTGGVGVLSCLTFGAASFSMGTLCLTCLGTYVLVAAFALVAWRALPGPLAVTGQELRGSLTWAAGLCIVGYLVLLGPALMTPEGHRTLTQELDPQGAPPQKGAPPGELERFLASLPPEEQQMVSQSLVVYRASPAQATDAFPTRLRAGPADAPVKIVDFTDVRCPHCRHLEEALDELRKVVPQGSFSVEPRSFPLDGECNTSVGYTDGTHVRCTGAKAFICLEGRPEYWDVRGKVFAEQDSLTVERILELGASGGMSRADLEACISSPQTQDKLKQDEAYALQYRPQGTPLVLVNGREATAVPAFLYAMALTGGNPDSPAFAHLAPPSTGTGAP